MKKFNKSHLNHPKIKYLKGDFATIFYIKKNQCEKVYSVI